ncbi:uncharacterized protein LOC144659637 isoform X2 [Oculina patagonica]
MEVLNPVPEAWREPDQWATLKYDNNYLTQLGKSHDKMLTPLHEHELQQVNPLTVYQAFGGRWKCDNCNAENDATSYPFHCRLCSFDLCYSCVHVQLQQNNLAHQHPLHYMETSRLLYQNQNGIWRCAVCKNTSDTLRQRFSYHCATCGNFEICRNCFEPKQHPVHVHVLKLVDTSLIYSQTGGNWVCDICGNSNRPYEKFAHHCSDCEFDVCHDCFKPHTTPLHIHPMYRADSHYVYAQFNGGWRCDNCGSVHNNPTDNKPWHCQTCEYDLCHACMSSTIEADQTGPSPGVTGRNHGSRGFGAMSSGLFNPTRQPVESAWSARDRLTPTSAGDATPSFVTEKGNTLAFPEITDDNSKCIICMEQPKNATLIHGDTGHCCCCWACAQVLKQRGDPCPICRAPIEHVIRQFNA